MPFPRSKKVHDEESLYDYAVKALGRRMRTVAELKRLLRQKQISGDAEAVIGNVVSRLKDQRYLNDNQYAANYAALRRDGSKHGRQRVITDLKVKGVHGDVIAKNPSQVEKYKGGDQRVLGFFIGQVKTATGGKANMKLVNDLLRSALG